MNDKLCGYEVTAGLPTIQRNHVHVILHGIRPVAHQVLVYIIFIDQPDFSKYPQQIFRKHFDQLLGMTTHAEALQMWHVARLPLSKQFSHCLNISSILGVSVDGRPYMPENYSELAVTRARSRFEKLLLEGGKHLPVNI